MNIPILSSPATSIQAFPNTRKVLRTPCIHGQYPGPVSTLWQTKLLHSFKKGKKSENSFYAFLESFPIKFFKTKQ